MATRQNHVAGKLTDMLFVSGVKMDSLAKAATADMPIGATWPPILYLDPNGGAKDVLLPAEADSENLVFFIVNTADAAENLVVKDDSDSSTIVTISQNGSAMVHCDGTTWTQVL